MFLFPEEARGKSPVPECIRYHRGGIVGNVQSTYCITHTGNKIKNHFDGGTLPVQTVSSPSVIEAE